MDVLGKHQNTYSCILAEGGAGAAEDYRVEITEPTGEPVIMSMEPENDGGATSASFRPPDIPASAYQLWQMHKRKRILREEYLDHWDRTVNETGTGRPVDALVTPTSPFAAVPHGKFTYATRYGVIRTNIDML